MIPALIRYSGGVELDPRRVLCRRLHAPTPSHWLRHQFVVDSHYSDPEWALCNWLENNFVGRFTVFTQVGTDGTLVVLGFEKATDAVMFRLMDGETAWREDDNIFS